MFSTASKTIISYFNVAENNNTLTIEIKSAVFSKRFFTSLLEAFLIKSKKRSGKYILKLTISLVLALKLLITFVGLILLKENF